MFLIYPESPWFIRSILRVPDPPRLPRGYPIIPDLPNLPDLSDLPRGYPTIPDLPPPPRILNVIKYLLSTLDYLIFISSLLSFLYPDSIVICSFFISLHTKYMLTTIMSHIIIYYCLLFTTLCCKIHISQQHCLPCLIPHSGS